jgi:hypothetical protein
VVESTRLESERAGNRTVGSNPTLSAIFCVYFHLVNGSLRKLYFFVLAIFGLSAGSHAQTLATSASSCSCRERMAEQNRDTLDRRDNRILPNGLPSRIFRFLGALRIHSEILRQLSGSADSYGAIPRPRSVIVAEH